MGKHAWETRVIRGEIISQKYVLGSSTRRGNSGVFKYRFRQAEGIFRYRLKSCFNGSSGNTLVS
jgi:hypothetical protein